MARGSGHRGGAVPGAIVITCEHAGHEVPPALKSLFRGHAATLRSHRGWDIGALGVAQRLAQRLGAPLLAQTVSRLVVEMNRSLDSPTLFSEFTRPLPEAARSALVERYWRPFREATRGAVDRAIGGHGRAFHLSVHSFTPVWQGRERGVEIGLLDDPRRGPERAFCRGWRGEVLGRAPEGWRIYMNRPYAGWTDGHTAALRRELPPTRYLGVEIEVNNRLIRTPSAQRRVGDLLAESVLAALAGEQSRSGGRFHP